MEVCPISMDTIKEEIVLPCCKNKFDYVNLMRWYFVNDTCPLCRADITDERIIELENRVNCYLIDVSTSIMRMSDNCYFLLNCCTDVYPFISVKMEWINRLVTHLYYGGIVHNLIDINYKTTECIRCEYGGKLNPCIQLVHDRKKTMIEIDEISWKLVNNMDKYKDFIIDIQKEYYTECIKICDDFYNHVSNSLGHLQRGYESDNESDSDEEIDNNMIIWQQHGIENNNITLEERQNIINNNNLEDEEDNEYMHGDIPYNQRLGEEIRHEWVYLDIFHLSPSLFDENIESDIESEINNMTLDFRRHGNTLIPDTIITYSDITYKGIMNFSSLLDLFNSQGHIIGDMYVLNFNDRIVYLYNDIRLRNDDTILWDGEKWLINKV